MTSRPRPVGQQDFHTPPFRPTHLVLGTTQIAKTLFANVADEENIRIGLDAAVLQGTKYTQYDNEAARIVTDARGIVRVALNANGHIGFDRKHRVEMGNIGDDLAA